MTPNLPDSKTFCVNPWLGLHYKMGESMSPCCMFNYDIKSNSIDSYLDSDLLSNTKQQLLQGERPIGCHKCFRQEDLGHVSKRQRDNEIYALLWALKFKNDTYKKDDNFGEYYVRLGNHCNIRCTTCSDQFSSGWISENKKFGDKYGPVIQIEATDPIWQHMKDHARHIHTIEFIGGEPFMMHTDKQAELFKYFVETGDAKHIVIKYNTNGTRVPTEQTKYWKYFKFVEINMSMDGVEDKFEYLRYPASWETFTNTLSFYQQLDATVKLAFVHTMSVFNIGYIEETLEFSKKVNVPLFLNLLSQPIEYSIFYSPNNVKEWIYDRIKHIEVPEIKNIASRLLEKHNYTTTSEKFYEKINELDKRRETNFSLTFRELAECMTSAA